MARAVIDLDGLSAMPLRGEVLAAMEPYLTRGAGNPGAPHRWGTRARKAMEAARDAVAELLGAGRPEEVVFTSGGTEANASAVMGAAWAALGGKSRRRKILLSRGEHPGVVRTAQALERMGFQVVWAGLDREGRIDSAQWTECATEEVLLACLHLGNHDTGTLQDVETLAGVCCGRGVMVHVDATTSGGWVPLAARSWGVDFMSLAPYRFYGPKGTGALYVREGAAWEPWLRGGRQEFGRRAGTEDVAGIAGAGAVAQLARAEGARWAERCRALQARMLEALRQVGVKCYGAAPGPGRDPRHLCLGFPGCQGEMMMLRLDLEGVCVGAGAGCLAPDEKVSPVLLAMGVPREEAFGVLLLGLRPELAEEELDRAAAAMVKTAHRHSQSGR